MYEFNVEGVRDNGSFKSLQNLSLVLQYLYMDKNHFIMYNDTAIGMDVDQNLIFVPTDKEVTNNSFCICANELTYLGLLDAVEQLCKNGEMEKIKVAVNAAKVIK